MRTRTPFGHLIIYLTSRSSRNGSGNGQLADIVGGEFGNLGSQKLGGGSLEVAGKAAWVLPCRSRDSRGRGEHFVDDGRSRSDSLSLIAGAALEEGSRGNLIAPPAPLPRLHSVPLPTPSRVVWKVSTIANHRPHILRNPASANSP
ncbi:hypothetical protein VTK26DRAFT_6929 [Humicola hyalothermophila]